MTSCGASIRPAGAGIIGIFNRSHYEDVVAVRVRELVPKVSGASLRRHQRLRTASDHEGTRVVKFFLHISREEQADVCARGSHDPRSHGSTTGDLAERGAGTTTWTRTQEAIERTSTDEAPWYVVPADRKWYRNWAVMSVLTQTLTDMRPKFPKRDELDGIVIE